jgi:hypothetical protein
MPTVVSTQIRIDNSNNYTYVLKRFSDNTYRMVIYQQNMATGCYRVARVQSGVCTLNIMA